MFFGSKTENKIIYVPYGISEIVKIGEYDKSIPFFSCGTSNRDYQTLINAFSRNKQKLTVICRNADIKNIDLPSNIEVLHNIYFQDYYMYLQKAQVVIIPLKDVNISAGQLVLLQAMSLGKILVVTRCVGIEDYVDENCAIIVEPHSSDAINEAVKYILKNKEKCILMARNAYKRYENEFTIKHFATRIADIFLHGGK